MAEEEEADVRRWIKADETAKEMLARVLKERPLLLIPPLHRVPLRVGNVVEVVGPSPSAKTHILLQAAVNCILPKEWNGVNYGGLEHVVMYVDMDCRFDVSRLAQLLKHRIMGARGSQTKASSEQLDACSEYDNELFAACMRRFLCIRCYDSSEFLATLKTMHYQLQKEGERHGTDVHFLMIDSIGAFYWNDRASASLAAIGANRRNHSLQSVTETIVQEIKKLMLVHPMLVLAAKTATLVNKPPDNEAKRFSRDHSSVTASYMRSRPCALPYREYMPSIWQSFVTHRALVRASEDGCKHNDQPVYLSQWLLPSLSSLDKFIVTDAGIYTIIS